jgi:hypothetical protein
MTYISWDTVGKRSFEIRPDEFVRIEFWSIGWKKMDMQSWMFREKTTHRACSVNQTSVPKQDHVAAQVPKEDREKLDHLPLSDVLLGMETCVEGEMPMLWRDRKCRDRRDFCPGACRPEKGSSSLRGPGTGNDWNKEEAALIKERQMGSKSCGFFLCEARRAVASSGWLSRSVREPASRASGSSIRERSSTSRHWRLSTEHQTPVGRPPRSASTSRDRSYSQLLKHLRPKSPAIVVSAFRLAATGVRGLPWDEVHGIPRVDRFDAIAPPNLARHRVSQPPNDTCGRLSGSEWPEPFASPMSGVCHRVSWRTIYNIPRLVSII